MQNTEILSTASSPGKFVFVRQRTLREVLSDTTTILREHFSAVFDPFLVSAGIGGVLTWALRHSGRNWIMAGGVIGGMILISFASAAAKIQLGELIAGRRPRPGNALKAVTTTYFPTLLGTTLLVTAAIGAGSMFIIPALILWLRLMYTQHFIVLEDAGFIESLEGSVALSRGDWRRGLGVLMFAYAPPTLTVLVAGAFMRVGIVPHGAMISALYSLWAGLLFLAQPVLAVATTLLYIDLRMPDIERQAKEEHADH